MKSKNTKTFFNFFLFLIILLHAITFGQDDIWKDHSLIDGGSIKLPYSFSAIETAFTTEKTKDKDFTQYSQRLINAKGARNDIVCSLKISRTWKEDIDGEVILERTPRKFIEKMCLEMLSRYSSFKECRLLSPKKYEIINNQP